MIKTKSISVFFIFLFFLFSNNIYSSERKPLAAYLIDSLWHIIDYDGKLLFKPIKLADIQGFSEGYFTVAKVIYKDTVWGFLSMDGRFGVPPSSKWVGLFKNGYALYANWYPGTGDLKYFGYVRTDGSIVCPPKYLEATEFSDGLAFVMNFDERGYIDTTCQIVRKFSQGFGEAFYDNLAVVQDSAGNFGYINRDYQIKVKLDFDEAYNFSEGIARVNKNGLFGFIDTTGDFVAPPVFYTATDFKETRAFVGEGENLQSIRWSLISPRGVKLTDHIFIEINDFSEGLAAVRSEDKWYFINLMGERFNKSEFEYCGSYKDGLAYARIKEKKKKTAVFTNGFIDITGKFILKIPSNAKKIIDLRTNKTFQFDEETTKK